MGAICGEVCRLTPRNASCVMLLVSIQEKKPTSLVGFLVF
jgi:hypothetical protein